MTAGLAGRWSQRQSVSRYIISDKSLLHSVEFWLPSFIIHLFFPLCNIYVGECVYRAGFPSVCVFIYN